MASPDTLASVPPVSRDVTLQVALAPLLTDYFLDDEHLDQMAGR